MKGGGSLGVGLGGGVSWGGVGRCWGVDKWVGG